MKKLQSIIAILLLVAMVVSVDQVSASIMDSSSEIEEDIFIHDQVIDVNIDIDEDNYQDMLDNATDEEYVAADITYDGTTYYNVAIRPKGNSSLRDVASSDSNRYSFKVDFDKYIDGQSMSGTTKINLNNLYSDDTLIAEYLGYEILEDIGAVASDTTYIALSINGEYFGLYLAVEEVNEEFLMKNYGNSDGQLYKPDLGQGSDLAYISDDPDDYEGIYPQNDDMKTDENFVELVTAIDKIIENGGETDEYNLTDIMNVDSFLSYLAVSSATVHMDAYQGGMYHNYYLYFNTDTEKFEWISWDLNMIFNGFPKGFGSDEEAIQALIDEPVIGQMSKYPLVQAIFTNDEYVEIYHEYLEELMYGYLEEDTFTETTLEVYNMIESYASIDPSAFFSVQESKESIFGSDDDNSFSLLDFVAARIENMEGQLDGSIESTNDGNGNESSGAFAGAGGQRGNKPGGGNVTEGEMSEDGEMPARGEMPADGEMPARGEMPADGEMPARGEMPADGEMPARGEMPADGEMPVRGEMSKDGEIPADGEMSEDGEMPAEGEMPAGANDFIAQVMELYEKGELSAEISEYIANDEMPPMDLLMVEMGELGIEFPMNNGEGGGKGMDNMTSSDSSDSSMSTEDIITFLASFAVLSGLSIYLLIRKY